MIGVVLRVQGRVMVCVVFGFINYKSAEDFLSRTTEMGFT